jgi:hypothetical protein
VLLPPQVLFALGAVSMTGMLLAIFKTLVELKTTANAEFAELRSFRNTSNAEFAEHRSFRNTANAEFAELGSFRKTTEDFQDELSSIMVLLLQATGSSENNIAILTEEVTRMHLINEGSFSSNYCKREKIESLEGLSKFVVDKVRSDSPEGLTANKTSPEAVSRVKNWLIAETTKLLPHFVTSLVSRVPGVSVSDFENLDRLEVARKLAAYERVLSSIVQNDKDDGLEALKSVKNWLFMGERNQISLSEQIWKEPLGIMIYLWKIGKSSSLQE